MKVHLKTLGCRLNEAELQQWAETLIAHGWQLSEADVADCIVVNTCAVTSEGARKSRQQIRKLHRHNPRAKLVVTGCYASLEPETVKELLGVDLVVDNSDKDNLAEQLIERYQADDVSMPEMATEPGAYAMFQRNRDRAFLKIQDGCRYRCTYCIVTVARGDERSVDIASLVAQVNQIQQQGIQEVVITGVHVGGYGTDLDTSLYDLVKALVNETTIPRIRFASIEPWDLPTHFFELFSEPRLMPHMHLPLQSGSDSVLRRMSRRCRQDSFAEIVQRARASHADFNITTDVIVGFPGETAQEWQESLDYIEAIGFSHIHCFSYSDREGTKAARLANKITNQVKKQRMKDLEIVAQKMKQESFEQQLNKNVPVLWESGAKPLENGLYQYHGYTPSYHRVQCSSDKNLAGQIIDTQLESVINDNHCLFGSINNEFLHNLSAPIVIKQL